MMERTMNTECYGIPSPPRPRGFIDHVFERTFEVDCGWETAWGWLMRPETFTRGQVWPYRVEFLETPQPDGRIARDFEVGTLNAHHGPFMNFCGVISKVEVGADQAMRDLEYGYGAYALSFRLIRPTMLRIRVQARGDDRCRVTVRVESFARSWIAGLWTLAQRCFWPGFGLALRKAGRKG